MRGQRSPHGACARWWSIDIGEGDGGGTQNCRELIEYSIACIAKRNGKERVRVSQEEINSLRLPVALFIHLRLCHSLTIAHFR